MKLRLIIPPFLFILFLLLPFSSSATPAYGDPPEEQQSIVQVLKWASETQIVIGENITVFVNITNWSDEIAYNLEITEPFFNDWAFTLLNGFEAFDWVELGSGGSVYYEYTIEMKSHGNYTIEPTTIEYTNVNSTEFFATSAFIPLTVLEVEPQVEFNVLWLNVLWASLAFVMVPVVILITNQLLWRK